MKLAILISKLVIWFGSKFNKSSSLPGKIALKLDKNILNKVKISSKIIAVTGSSGKGTTSKLLANLLKSQGFKVVHNHRGGNLKNGIVTMLIEACSLSGKIKANYIVYEIDERYFKHVSKFLKPNVVVITNITRDQPPRHGHFDYVYNDIKKCLTNDMHLILNSDDPYLQKFTIDTDCKVTYYGINKNEYSYIENKYENLIIQYCPKCNTKLNYNYYHFEIYGDYYCPKCNFKRAAPEYEVTNIDYGNETMVINNKYQIKILNNILYNIYNIAAVIATMGFLKFDIKDYIQSINTSEYDHKLLNHYKYHNNDIYVLYNKNENSSSFNQSLNYVSRDTNQKIVIIGWETISHRYKFSDISWIYDINFESLNNSTIEKIICVGSNCYDIASRLKLAEIPNDKILIFNSFNQTLNNIFKQNNKIIYAIVNPDYVLPLLKKLKGH